MHAESGQNDPLVKFLPFEKFHLAPVRDVTPAALKDAAHLARSRYRDREPIKLNTALNFLARRLGFHAGFAGFRQEHATKLSGFMQTHGLTHRADLIRTMPRMALVSLQPREVADRLFFSRQPVPLEIFTGHDVDWFEVNDRHFRQNPWRQHPLYETIGYIPHEAVMAAAAQADARAPELGLLLLEAAVTECDFSVRAAGNLMGDQLLRYPWDEYGDFRFVPTLYKPEGVTPEDFREHERKVREVAKFFRAWIRRLRQGWVRVLPYNGSLIFLQGADGTYDFVFPRLRDGEFDHNPFLPHLRTADLPKSSDAYHFRRWMYFEYEGWMEEESHRAEITFCATGGQPKQYPGAHDILRQHLILGGTYSPPEAGAPGSTGFLPVRIDGILLHVSNLVSIAQFKAFMADHAEYARYSREPAGVDRWETVNSDDDPSLPASVTWHDANAFAAWISRTRKLPVRLPTEVEYRTIAHPILNPREDIPAGEFLDFEHERLCRFSHPDGTPIQGHPPYLPEELFQDLKFNFIPAAMVWKRSAAGLAFLFSQHFGEWLNEEASVANTLTLSSLCRRDSLPSSARFAAHSTGKYKSKKIGFRLVYRGDDDGTPATAG